MNNQELIKLRNEIMGCFTCDEEVADGGDSVIESRIDEVLFENGIKYFIENNIYEGCSVGYFIKHLSDLRKNLGDSVWITFFKRWSGENGFKIDNSTLDTLTVSNSDGYFVITYCSNENVLKIAGRKNVTYSICDENDFNYALLRY
jgi:hypothetical protein